MSRTAGAIAPDPQGVATARDQRRLTQAELAGAVTAWIGEHDCWRDVTPSAISKIERGTPVDPCVLHPVLIHLGLEDDPARRGPHTGQSPGAWIRELREARGIARDTLCLRATSNTGGKALTPRRLRALESGRVPGRQSDRRDYAKQLHHAFDAFHIDVSEASLLSAFEAAPRRIGRRRIKKPELATTTQGVTALLGAGIAVTAARRAWKKRK